MENQSTSIESLIDRIKEYVETRLNLLKLKAIDKASGILSGIISQVILFAMIFIFFVFLNIGIALYLGDLLGKLYYGFLIVAGFYFIIGLIVYLCRNKLIKGPISNMMIKKLLD